MEVDSLAPMPRITRRECIGKNTLAARHFKSENRARKNYSFLPKYHAKAAAFDLMSHPAVPFHAILSMGKSWAKQSETEAGKLQNNVKNTVLASPMGDFPSRKSITTGSSLLKNIAFCGI